VKTSLPTKLYGATRENPVINGLIYVTHGQAAPFYTSNYVYDPVPDRWRTKSSAQHPRDVVGCCVLDGKLYVIGGRANKPGSYTSLASPNGLIDHEIYDHGRPLNGASVNPELLSHAPNPGTGAINPYRIWRKLASCQAAWLT
jgi:hypothetical protein